MTIWKYPLETTDAQDIAMPSDAKILCVQVQGDTPCLWALVSPDLSPVNRRILTFGTGHDIPLDSGHYIGSYQLHGGALVFHVFEAQ